jgi:hypothetical protein
MNHFWVLNEAISNTYTERTVSYIVRYTYIRYSRGNVGL